ncbi:hypothetical protein LTR10_013451 [Elasticomyces elasticus]|uniref:DUF7605 domain-containing protein n=1 Tax=Exophiala sideris TaxID=1016849 RepID=A0ABR0J4U0_9EURO|nr:hypothetical protein LTR10_013451 [Elasticomyces elasticus]KAK5027319.1 hypothetical protein LTS07_006921 [Exophiala sideris]KAK5034979.1 hypothetical protein LTR13_006161 [Exophiala sideris]KAK5056287.1 hypothetical protein LTR69_007828 [Exophiala sideris]KAK5181224.1 hypothetical protein LTR44_006555 [Eurotiomycetes sp. CCFEE 6388]
MAFTVSTRPHTEVPPYLDPHFQKAGDLAVEDGSAIYGIYKKAPRSPPIDTIQEADTLSRHRPSVVRRIGLLGPTGAGKSSLIVALLGVRKIAMVGGGGEAVTCFPVHYHYRLLEQQAPYVIRCVFPDKLKTGEVFSMLLNDLNIFEETDRGDFDAEDEAAAQDQYHAAEDALKALFANMRGFDLRKLKIGGKITKGKARQNLSCFESLLQWPSGIEGGIWTKEADTETELQKHLKDFHKSGLWPLIESLTIFMDAPLLRYGVVLVDLPGYGDTNFARVKIARETQAKCDDLFFVTEIKRVRDSSALKTIIQENASRPSLGLLALQTVTIVCTHSALVDENDAREEFVDAVALEAAKTKQDELEAADAPSSRVKEAKRQVDAIVMEGRNNHIISELKKTYGANLGEDNFAVFCVDSKRAFEKEWAELSGIFDLRDYVEYLPAKRLFQVNNALIGHRHDAMVSSFETWVQASRLKQGAMEAVLPGPDALRHFHEKLEGWESRMAAEFVQTVIDPLRQKSNPINVAASTVATSWSSIHHSTALAICRRDGVHAKCKRGPVDWNQELIECFTPLIQGDWRTFEAKLQPSLLELKTLINKAAEDYPRICYELHAPPSFLRSVRMRQETLDYAAGLARDEFQHGLGWIKRNAAVSQGGAYVRKTMVPAYSEAMRITGKDSKARRIDVLQDHVASPKFVADFADQILSDFQELLRKEVGKLLEAVESTANGIQADVDTFQGRRDEIPLFKLDPGLGTEAEKLLEALQFRVYHIDELAAPARNQASKLYGEDVLAGSNKQLMTRVKRKADSGIIKLRLKMPRIEARNEEQQQDLRTEPKSEEQEEASVDPEQFAIYSDDSGLMDADTKPSDDDLFVN